MKPCATEIFVSRESALSLLSKVRYPHGVEKISRATLHRWRNLAGIRATAHFNAEEIGRLTRIAQYAYQGLTYEQIQETLGVPNHDRPKANPQPSESPAGQSNPFAGLY